MSGVIGEAVRSAEDYSGLNVPNNSLLRIAKKSVAPATSTVEKINRIV
jgi:hypothetical protein